MAGFRYNATRGGGVSNMRSKYLPVTSGVTLSPGDTLKIVSDRWTNAASGDVVDGVMEGDRDKVGNAGGTVKARGRCVRDREFEIAQGAISDANSEIGDKLDISATFDGVAADSNHDLQVTRYDRARDLLYVRFLNPGI